MTRTKTYSLSAKDIDKHWHVLDASGQTLGRLATQVAALLMGKHKPTYSRHLDMGDFVIIVNADKVRVTGKKLDDKIYYRHTGYMGGLKETPLGDMLQRHPSRVIELAVRGMLPRNRLSRHLLRHLKVYAGPDHPHEAQVNESRKREQRLQRMEDGKPKAAAATLTSTPKAAKAPPKRAPRKSAESATQARTSPRGETKSRRPTKKAAEKSSEGTDE
jgi:large subunit ribosomal protein L13